MKPLELALWMAAAVSLGFTCGVITAGKTMMGRATAQAQKCAPGTPLHERQVFSMPLPYAASVTQSGDGRAPRTRYYYPGLSR